MPMLRTITRTPHEQDKRDIAARAKRAIRNARNICGPAVAYATWNLIDRRGIEPKRTVYCCRRMPGTGWTPTADEAFGEKALERDPENHFEFRGRTVYKFRYQSQFGYLADYNPVPQAVLDERRAKRLAKIEADRIERERRQGKQLSLFQS